MFDIPKRSNNPKSSAGYRNVDLFKKSARCTTKSVRCPSPNKSAEVSYVQRPKTAPSTRNQSNYSQAKIPVDINSLRKNFVRKKLNEKASRSFSITNLSKKNNLCKTIKPYLSKELQTGSSSSKFTKTASSSTLSNKSSKKNSKM